MPMIPILDLAQSDGKLASQLDRAFREIGFASVVNHDVPATTIRSLYGAANAFFDLPAEAKRQVARPRPDQNRGYIGYGEETLARLGGRQTPPDYKEIFSIGPFDLPDDAYYTGPAAYPSFAPNLWPSKPPALQPAMRAYWQAITVLAQRMLGISARALGLPADYFAAMTDRQISMLRLICYPPYARPPQDGQLRAGVHTDLNMLTFVHANSDTGGLEVRARDGSWVAPSAAGDAFVVNVGDILMRWTNDYWVSTPHRVANPPDGWRERRISIPFFFQANYDTIVDCLRPGETPKYPPVSVGAYRAERFAKTAG
ncbi:MAG TPA: 2-oxoglutarate and iron-dependent oxygenase domain-containing protein [Reyranella sp.]